MERNTGHFVPDWDEKRFRQERIHRQSEAIVCKLESMGVPCRVSLPYPIMAIGELTGQAELTETRYRHMQMIPEVAQQDRRGFLRELTYFLEREAGSQGFSRSRYAVVTNGPRVPWYGDLRGETQAFNARIRRWSYDAARRFGIELLLRSNEHTFREMDGVHLHANIVYRLTRRLPKVEWAEFLVWSRQRLGALWKDCGALRDPAEVVKYSLKLGTDGKNECLGLEDLSAEQLLWLHTQTFRQKPLAALGAFGEWRSSLKDNGLKVARLHGGALVVVKKPDMPNGSKKSSGRRMSPENVILGRIPPCPRFSGLMEPVTLVAGFTAVPKTGLGQSGLDILQTRMEQASRWAAAKVQPEKNLMVHTNTRTVQVEREVKGAKVGPPYHSQADGPLLRVSMGERSDRFHGERV